MVAAGAGGGAPRQRNGAGAAARHRQVGRRRDGGNGADEEAGENARRRGLAGAGIGRRHRAGVIAIGQRIADAEAGAAAGGGVVDRRGPVEHHAVAADRAGRIRGRAADGGAIAADGRAAGADDGRGDNAGAQIVVEPEIHDEGRIVDLGRIDEGRVLAASKIK